jgi:seryl-tRNA synthetase
VDLKLCTATGESAGLQSQCCNAASAALSEIQAELVVARVEVETLAEKMNVTLQKTRAQEEMMNSTLGIAAALSEIQAELVVARAEVENLTESLTRKMNATLQETKSQMETMNATLQETKVQMETMNATLMNSPRTDVGNQLLSSRMACIAWAANATDWSHADAPGVTVEVISAVCGDGVLQMDEAWQVGIFLASAV